MRVASFPSTIVVAVYVCTTYKSVRSRYSALQYKNQLYMCIFYTIYSTYNSIRVYQCIHMHVEYITPADPPTLHPQKSLGVDAAVESLQAL